MFLTLDRGHGARGVERRVNRTIYRLFTINERQFPLNQISQLEHNEFLIRLHNLIKLSETYLC